MENNHDVILKEQAQLATEESLNRTLFTHYFHSNSFRCKGLKPLVINSKSFAM